MLGWILLPAPCYALTDLKCYLMPGCTRGWGSSSSNPSTGGRVKINPSAVPTEQGFGIEGLFFKDEVDLAIVHGNGRVGAAISPSNSEETFFGPPGFELPQDYLERKQNVKKYPNQKVTLATAFNLIDKQGSGLDSYSLKLGLMAKYNKLTYNVSPGAGLSGTLGPFTFGGSIYNDETRLDYSAYGSTLTPKISYQVQTYNVGLFLSSLILDYSHLQIQSTDPSSVNLITASLMAKKFIITASRRSEESVRPSYNYQTHLLEVEEIKHEYFGGVQYSATNNLMLGVLYNYYLLREYSVAATVFF